MQAPHPRELFSNGIGDFSSQDPISTGSFQFHQHHHVLPHNSGLRTPPGLFTRSWSYTGHHFPIKWDKNLSWFKYQSIADYATSSYQYTVILFTKDPRNLQITNSLDFATGYSFGQFDVQNYPAIPSARHPAPDYLQMPDFSKPLGGWGSGANVFDATFYLVVMEEYGTGEPSIGRRVSVVINEIIYNATDAAKDEFGGLYQSNPYGRPETFTAAVADFCLVTYRFLEPPITSGNGSNDDDRGNQENAKAASSSPPPPSSPERASNQQIMSLNDPATPAQTSGKGKRKADEVDGSPGGTPPDGKKQQRATFAADPRPHRASGTSGSSHAPSSYSTRKRARLSVAASTSAAGLAASMSAVGENSSEGGSGGGPPSRSASRQSHRQNATNTGTWTSSRSRNGGNPNISGHNPPGRSQSRASHRSHGGRSQHQTQDDRAASRLSRRGSISAASIPISALISPHAPSVSRHSAPYHMRDPHKPPRVQSTSWSLSFPHGYDGEEDYLRGRVKHMVRSLKTNRALKGLARKFSRKRDADGDQDKEKQGYDDEPAPIGWTEGGGSPLHAWLFFAGFIVFPLWWIASFLGIRKTRRIGSGQEGEKGVVLDDPQVEHGYTQCITENSRKLNPECRVFEGRWSNLASPISLWQCLNLDFTIMKNKNKQTKFPVARIKKIMQKDEDVGKVAQATPIVISKALELFLATLVEKSAKVTTDRGSKKVEAYHLKHAVETTEMFDFLKEIVEGVPDPSAGGTIQMETGTSEKKKKAKGKKAAADGEGAAAPKRRRKKKVEENGDAATEGNQDEDATMGEGEKSEPEERMRDDDDDYDGRWEKQRRATDDEEDDDS
ncbi:hypothetical protein D9758_002787 [Tetrapyrgos nigripes]|uniref:Transcription factor CBF/NF-Y/archaeal histone domain-containing protein n=1 Tax=Tetrapyrgos nigripes TaxID=182062 RepID=A0A8H5GQP3_9AGAR|nr:hypothetical protein D9758_002787 [Tetrapyrgos nigripes]